MQVEEVVKVLAEIADSIEGIDICYFPFILMTDGFHTNVEFAGQRIWSSEDDCREFNEDTNEYEPMKEYLVAEARKVLFEYSDMLDRII